MNHRRQLQCTMTNITRTMYPCPTCGKPRRCNIGECHKCRIAQGKHIAKKKHVYKRKLQKCEGCGIEKRSPTKLCRKCAAAAGRYSRSKSPKSDYCACGARLSNKHKSSICRHCEDKRRRDLANELRGKMCSVCGVNRPNLKSLTGRCSVCEGASSTKIRAHAARVKYYESRGEPMPDLDVILAAKASPKIKKCPTCGVKITTHECVACAVLNRVGEKGFR